MVEESLSAKQHEITITNRNSIEISGITRLESFDREEFLLYTECGYLGVRGQDLHIKNLDLDLGRISIEGQITDISYIEGTDSLVEKNNRLFGRLFR